jgi:hypothetical protein
MSKNINKKQLLAPRLPLLDLIFKAQEKLVTQDVPLLLTFWGSKGCGRTTFLNVVRERFTNKNEIDIAGFWDASKTEVSNLSRAVLISVANQSSKYKLVLIDNLDALLLKADGGDFFEFESNTILKLIERGDTLIVTSSQIEINLWQEYDVRDRQENHQLVPLKLEELEEVIGEANISSEHAYQMTFGHPKMLEALMSHRNWTEKEISHYAQKYFLENIHEQTKELARIASLLPVFNIYILREIRKESENNKSEQSDMLMWYNDRINELTRQWIIQFDSQVGAYRFTDSAVRRLIARDFSLNSNEEFHRIHSVAAEYYQEETKSISYLPQIIVSAIYHLAKMQISLTEEKRGAYCLRWIRDMYDSWRGARWEQVLESWESGANDYSIKEELRSLIGSRYYSKITETFQENKDSSEV